VQNDFCRRVLDKLHDDFTLKELHAVLLASGLTTDTSDASSARRSTAKTALLIGIAIALFFLQIQGSGRLVLPDGARPLVGFAASNGRGYVSIGKLLVDEGHLTLDEASMGGIRRWIAAHPDERERVLHANPRYIFFARLAGEPIGSLRVPVTAGRTIATDPAVYPPGVLAFVHVPATTQPPTAALSRLVLNQDTGAAIRGPAHVDIFFGEGPESETRAGRLHTNGDLFLLVPRT